jgi:membrane protein DedA with SNARE-associated domain
MKEDLLGYLASAEAILQAMMLEHGLSILLVAQFVSGMGLLLVVPDGLVTPTFVLLYANNIIEVIGIAMVSAAALLAGNFILYLFFRLLGERFLSKNRRETRLWRFMAWAVKRNSKVSLLLFRLLPVGAELIAIPAGLLKVRIKTFLFYSYIGILIFELVLGLGAWYGIEGGIFEQLLQQYGSELPLRIPGMD